MTNAGRSEAASLGERLRAIRRERGLTLAQVAEASGLTKGFISQLERGLTSISLSSLARVCAVLDVRFGEVLDERPAADVAPSQPSGFSVLEAHEDVLLSPRDEPRLALLESRVPPGAGAGRELYTLPAELEVVYVLSGALDLHVGDDVHELRAGGTLTYSPQDPHTWRNPSETDEAVVLWFSVPNPFARPGAEAGSGEGEG